MASQWFRVERADQRFQPNAEFKYSNNPQYELDQRTLASLVGVVALGLPLCLAIAGLSGVCFYESISHFYYAQFWGDVFVAALVFIATFMIAYRGENRTESTLATMAGLCAFFVAIFPTEGRGCEEESFPGRALVDIRTSSSVDAAIIEPATRLGEFFQLYSGVGWIHFGSAAILFAFLAYYSLRVFTRVTPSQYEEGTKLKTRQKRWRNVIYEVAGAVILISMCTILLNFVVELVSNEPLPWWDTYKLTFWLESLALWAFGTAWIVKGRIFNRVLLDP